MAISFHSSSAEYRLRQLGKTRLWLAACADQEGCELIDLKYIWCSDEELHRINLDFLGHDTFTDVIAFGYEEGSSIEAEVYISIDRVRDNAKVLGHRYRQELDRVMVHALLHLCGYRDKTASEKNEMTEKENFYLSLRDFSQGKK